MPQKNNRRSVKSTAQSSSHRDEAQLLIEAQEELNLAWRNVMLESEEFGAPAEEQHPAPEPASEPAPASTGARRTNSRGASARGTGTGTGARKTSQKREPRARNSASENRDAPPPEIIPAQNQRQNVQAPQVSQTAQTSQASAAKTKGGRRPRSEKLRIIPLGGLLEVGKNITLYEYGQDIIVVDCGSAFPEEDMLGIDLVVPDMSYLVRNKKKVRGVFITHGHEDHIGSLPFLLREFNPPIFATPFARGLIEAKLEEAGLLSTAKIATIHPGDVITAGCFSLEAINVNHSMPDAVSYAITTPLGVVIHTGDFKIDFTPVGGEMIDLTRFGEYGRQGVLALLSDSTNAERTGYTMSERTVGETFDTMFRGCSQRLIVTTFASNMHRIQQIIEAAVKVGRKVAITGRSMEKTMELAVKLGYAELPKDTIIDISQIKNYSKNKLVIVTTGSQGETLSALYRMAFGTHRQVEIGPGDRVIMSASQIPGNENAIGKVINELMMRGADVVYERLYALHVSGHACQEELKLILGLVKPKYFMPLHGEYKHLRAHARLAEQMGVPKKNIFISENGRSLDITSVTAKLGDTVQSGQLLYDGSNPGDVGNVVLRDRKTLSEDGIIIAVFVLGSEGEIVSGPEIITRGFVYNKDSEGLIDKLASIAGEAAYGTRGGKGDWSSVKQAVKGKLGDFIYKQMKKRPMILPVIMEARTSDADYGSAPTFR